MDKELIEKLRSYKMSPQERFEQRVSFVYGQQDHDNPNPLSKEQIRSMLAEQNGYPEDPRVAELTARITALEASLAEAVADIARLRARLEIPEAPFDNEQCDGIACRDETIRQQDERIARLRAEAEGRGIAARRQALEEAAKVADSVYGSADATLRTVKPEGLAAVAVKGNVAAASHIAQAIRALADPLLDRQGDSPPPPTVV